MTSDPPLTMVALYRVTGHVITGDIEGNLHWLTMEEYRALPAFYSGEMFVIPAYEGDRLVVPIPFEANVPSFEQEEIRLAPFEVHGWRGRAGYGPKSHVWYIDRQQPRLEGQGV